MGRSAADRHRRSKGGHNTLSKSHKRSAKRLRGKQSRAADREAATLPHFDGQGDHRYEDGRCVYCDKPKPK